MPSITVDRSDSRSPYCGATSRSASATGCCGTPSNTLAISLRHHASLRRATAGSETSSTTSSTSRQNA
jgi:hypothetical protein